MKLEIVKAWTQWWSTLTSLARWPRNQVMFEFNFDIERDDFFK